MVSLDDTAGYRKAEADPRYLVFGQAGAAERLENVVALIVGYTHAMVGDGDNGLVFGIPEHDFHWSALRRILNGIADEIVEHLFNSQCIAVKQYRAVGNVY